MRIARRKEAGKMQPPMTPMIDVVFNLLIFFLLTPSQTSEGYLTTNLPRTSGPVAGKEQKDIKRIKIELFDEEPNGENVSIVLNENQSLGANFQTLLASLQALRATGLPPDHPVLISPTMATRHKWVVRAFDMAVAARFTEIHFAVPYE